MKKVSSDSYHVLIASEEEGHNIACVHWVWEGEVRIGPQGEGAPAPGGIVTKSPEDVRWFAHRLLELADELEKEKTEPRRWRASRILETLRKRRETP